MESPFEEHKFHTTLSSYGNQSMYDKLESTVFWKFEDPWDKESNLEGVPQYKQKHFIATLLDKKGEELAKNKSDETLLGNRPDNLFVITNDAYENAKQKVLAGRKAREDEVSEFKEKDARATANKQAEEVRVNNLIAVGGENYFQYMNKLWNEKDPYAYSGTKLKGDKDIRVRHFKKVLEALSKRLQIIQNSPNREGGFQYNCVSKREILGNGFRSCSPANFAFPKEEWIAVRESFGNDRINGCHTSPMFSDKNCVLVLYKDVITAVDKEFDCLSTFGVLGSKISNAFKRTEGGKTRCKTKGKGKGKGSKRRRANKKTKNKK
jgi:hypothetical protein